MRGRDETTKAWSPRAAVSTWSAETVAKTRMQGRAAAGRGARGPT